MRQPIVPTEHEGRSSKDNAGSALVMAIVVLAMLTAMGIALVSLANSDVRMNQADMRGKRAFFIAEAGLEDAREQVRANNIASTNPASLDDELLIAAGTGGAIDFNVNSLQPIYDSSGTVTGFTGMGNDVPLKAMTTFGQGRYAAFLTNDPADTGGVTSTNDTNDRLMITAIGTGPNRVVEIVQAVVERDPFPLLPSTITMLGPDAGFDGGSSSAKEYKGDDCDGVSGYTGIPGLYVPVVGTIGSTSEATAEAGVQKPDEYTTGGQTGNDTVANVESTIDPLYKDCDYLLDLAEMVRGAADYICSGTCPHLGSASDNTLTFVDGDLTLGPGMHRGFVWVTGQVFLNGNTDFEGVLFVVGEGYFERSGGGNGHTWGSTLVADVAGPDNTYGTGDDCTGPSDGFDETVYHVDGTGNHDTVFCMELINETMNGFPLEIVDFRQR